jgi:hypothetical protein
VARREGSAGQVKRGFQLFAQFVVAICAAITLHSLVFAVAEFWPRTPMDGESAAHSEKADIRIQTSRFITPALPVRVDPPTVLPPPEPEVALKDPRKHGPGPLGLRGVRWSDDLGDDGAAFEAAIRWLDRHQRPDGGWPANSGCRDERHKAAPEETSDPGATAAALLVYLGDGLTHLSRRRNEDRFSERTFWEGESVKQAIKWLIGHFPGDGKKLVEWAPKDLALATLAMVEAFGLTNSALFRDYTQRMVDTVLLSRAGGDSWKTVKGSIVDDAEATAWALMAIGIARDAGLRVPALAMRDAAYAVAADESEAPLLRSAMANTACLLSHDPVQTPGWPREFRLEWNGATEPSDHDLHTVHWVLLAARQSSARDGSAWKAWRNSAVTRVIEAQCAGKCGCRQGSWDPPEGARLGRVGETAMNALTLLTWKRYAPTAK